MTAQDHEHARAAVGTSAAGPPGPPAVAAPTPFPGPLLTHGARTGILLVMLLSGGTVGVGLGQVRVGEALEVSPFAVEATDVERLDTVAQAVGIASVLTGLVAGVLFLAWFHRAYRAAYAATDAMGSHRPGWAIGAWFVPFMNLVRPARLMRDLWRMSASRWARATQAADVVPVPRTVAWWWGAYLTTVVVGQLASALNDDRGVSLLGTRLSIIAAIALYVAGVLLQRLIDGITRLQRPATADAPSSRALPPTRGRWGARAVALGVATIVAVALGLAMSRIDIDDQALPWIVRDAAGGVSSRGLVALDDLAVGDCLDGPADAGVSGHVVATPCDAPHAAEVYHAFTVTVQRDIRYPGEDALLEAAFDTCRRTFEPRVGVPYEDALDRDFQVLYPSRASWAAGDRKVHCLVFNIDGSLLNGQRA